jgi:hypothetical protein
VWSIVCGLELVDGSPDLADYPDDEQLEKLGRDNHLIPFPFIAKNILPEEFPWNQVQARTDYYPTLQAVVGSSTRKDDFDTGAPMTLVSDRLVQIKESDISIPRKHLEKPFQFTPKKINVTINASDGSSQTAKMVVGIVKDWGTSAFVDINKNRLVLFGRDILKTFDLEVCLNSKLRITRINFL